MLAVADQAAHLLLGAAISEHPDRFLAMDAIRMAVAVRGGSEAIRGVVFHTDKGASYTAGEFTALCVSLGITQSMGRVGSCFDNAAAESWFSTLEHEVLSRHRFTTKAQARTMISRFIWDFSNPIRLHSTCQMMSPMQYETTTIKEAA